MVYARRSESLHHAEPTVHNDGETTVSVGVRVHDDDVAVRLIVLDPGESTTVSAPPHSTVEVHTPDGSATAPASGSPLFVVRDGSVVVAPV